MIAVVYGTRPEAIKLAPVIDELDARGVPNKVICTGQHQSLLRDMPILPDVTLSSVSGRSLSSFVSSTALRLAYYELAEGVDLTLVQGDTSSAFAGALASFNQGIPVGHVEAGLRSGRLDAPYPEEGYRRMIDAISERHYAPTTKALQALIAEGHTLAIRTGNTGVDAALRAGKGKPAMSSKFALVTLHRREALGQEDGIRAVCQAIARLPIPVVFPVHPNPSVSVFVRQALGGLSHVHLTDPLSYEDLLTTMQASEFVLTDSGGIQEEAPIFGVPLLIAREVTERSEIFDDPGCYARLVGFDEELIVTEALRIIRSPPFRQQCLVFGDGKASKRIVDDALAFLARLPYKSTP